MLLLLLLLVWLAVLPQVLRVQVDSGQVQYFGVHQWSLKLKRQCTLNRIRICTDIHLISNESFDLTTSTYDLLFMDYIRG